VARAGSLPLIVHTNTGIYQPGDTVYGQILLGTNTAPATGVYGIAFTLNAGAFAKPNTLQLSQATSWLLSADSSITFSRRTGATLTDAAQTRTNHNNTTGYGPIGNFSFVVDTGISNGSMDIIEATAALCLNSVGDTIGLQTVADSITAIVNNITNLQASDIVIYPNPTTGSVIVHLTGAESSAPLAQVYNQLGQIVLTQFLARNINILNLSSLSAGIYYIKITVESNLITTQKVCLTK
jgi:hypothetical protein